MTIKRRLARIVALVRANRLERELSDEVRAHLELAEHDAIARGLDPAAARRDAVRQFGGIEQMKEAHRDDRSVRWIENLLKDVRYGLASLRREPVFAIIAIAVLALGIGANTAVFSIVDAVLLKPLPFPDPERIVRMWESTPTGVNSTTALNFVELRRRLHTFEAFSAEVDVNATAEIGGEPVRLQGRRVSANHFDVFGVAPMLGRTFAREEDQPGAANVLIISHAAWQQRFGGDPGILERDVRLDGVPFRIIGVMPPGALDRDRRRPRMAFVSFWKPLALTTEQLEAGSHFLNPVGRLKPGFSIADAQLDMLAARAAIADLIPQWKKDWSVKVEPFDAVLIDGTLRRSLYIALGAVVLVLLIACANLANLLLARGAARQKEIALRSALGASRGRLIAQLLTESLVLGLLGGLAGVALAAALMRAAVPLLPVAIPFTATIALDVRVLLFATMVAVVVSALVGLLPALRLSSASAADALNHGSRGSSGRHDGIRRVIVGAEVAVSIVLICGSVLLVKSLMRLQQVDTGVRAPHVVTASVDIGRDKYPAADEAIAFYDRLIERVEAIPGVESASVAGDVPLEGTGGENLRTPATGDKRLLVRFKRADPGYFRTIGLEIVKGRGFTRADRVGSSYVTLINEALAKDLNATFGMTDPLGQVVDLPAIGFNSSTVRQPMQIIGIVKNERVESDLRAGVLGIAYVPIAQAPMLWTKLAVRTQLDTATIVPSMRAALREVDDRVALADVRTVEQLRELSLSGMKEPAWLIGIFAALSALLAALGLYGVVSHSVSQQQREIGIRMALGARSGEVLSMIVRSVLTTIAAGLVIGLAGAVALTRVTQSLLFEVSALDPFAFAAAALVMSLIGVTAAIIPATRATRVDPTTALRSE
jgi:putative ABC transport system permease protein